MSSSIAKAATRKVISLPAWGDTKVIIRRVSVKQIGLDAGIRIVSNMEAASLAAENAEEANMLVQQAKLPSDPRQAPTPDRPPTQPLSTGRADVMPPELKKLIMDESELTIVRQGLVEPTFEEMCEAYGADPFKPQLEMGPDWDVLVQEIMTFSGEQSMGHIGMRGSPEEVERFPENARLDAERNGQTVGQNASRTRKRKRR